MSTSEAEAAYWNLRFNVGTPVYVKRDNGDVLSTRTKSNAWTLDNRAVIQVEGISGCYALHRITAKTLPQK